MSKNHHFRAPALCNYEVEYYFQETADEYPSKVFPFHLHDQLEIYILLEGDVSFAVESSVYRLSPGDAIITKPNEMHNCILNTRSVHKHLCLWFDPSDTFLFDSFLAHGFGKSNLIVPSAAAKQELYAVLEDLRVAAEDKNAHAQLYLTLHLLDIYRRFTPVVTESETIPPTFRAILSDIDENFKTIRSIDYLTSKYYISASTLGRLFQRYLHTSPKKYLETKRLAHSRLLLKSGKTVLDACMESGFPDYSNYIRLFKSHFSITPGQYRSGEGK